MSIYTEIIGGFMRFIFIAIVLLVVSTSTSFALPQLEVESSLVDWGRIYSGEKREHRFILKNVGDTPLVIEHVHSSCGCTAAMVSSKTILPMAETELRVHFNSKSFRGKVTKKVRVVSNDPQQPKKSFTLQAQVVSELKVAPSRLSIGAIAAGKGIERTVTFTNLSDVIVKIKGVRSTSRHISLVNVPDTLQPNQQAVVTVKIQPPTTGKAVLNGYLLIDAHGHARNQLKVPVLAKVVR